MSYIQMSTDNIADDQTERKGKNKKKKECLNINYNYILLIVIFILIMLLFYKNNQLDLPKGIIVSWYGSIEEIPKGWALCDGNNTTPDLRNRFIIGGGDKYDIGQKGGNSFIVLDKSNLPKLGKGYFSSPSVNGKYHERTDELIEYLSHYDTGFSTRTIDWRGDEYGVNYKIDLNEGFESVPVNIMNPYYSNNIYFYYFII